MSLDVKPDLLMNTHHATHFHELIGIKTYSLYNRSIERLLEDLFHSATGFFGLLIYLSH